MGLLDLDPLKLAGIFLLVCAAVLLQAAHTAPEYPWHD